MADRIPGARRVPIGGPDTMIFLAPGLADEVERFVQGVWGEAEPETVLSTVLFTDIVGPPSEQPSSETGGGRS